MARIQSVTIRRFKQLQEITLQLGSATLLIGANNSGKSSVLQAIHFAVSIAQSAKLVGEGVAWAKDAFELSFNPSQLIYTPVADVMTLANGGTLQEPRPSRVEIEFLMEDATRCTVGLRRGRNRNIAVSIEGRALGEQLMNIAKPFTVYAPGLAGVPKDERYLSPGVVRRIVARGDANLVLRNVLLMLHDQPEAWATFLADMQTIFDGLELSIDFTKDTDETIGAYFRMNAGPWLPLDAAGTSILQASQLLAYITLFKPRVLILDEPDSHLHPDNQRALCEFIYRVASDRNFQAIVSTHSRHVLDSTKNRGAVVWISKGQIVSDTDVSTTSLLLDLGALDSVDYFANGVIKCVVATEDSDRDPLRALLWSNGFVESETEVASYTGCSKTDAALVLGRFLLDKAPQLGLVVHRDADYQSAARVQKFESRLEKASILPFLTEHNDVEGYYLCPKHLAHLNPPLTEDRVAELIELATQDTAKKSIAAIVNLRTEHAFADRKDSGKSPDHGQIAVEATTDYSTDSAKYRRGDLVLGRLTALLQQELKVNPKIFGTSPHLKSAALAKIAARIWPQNAQEHAPQTPPPQQT